MINSLELILYLPLINVSFPGLIVLVYSVLIPISTVDIIPESVTLHIFNLSADLKNNNGNKLELLNKESTITILNLGSIFYFFLLTLLIYSLIGIFYKKISLKFLEFINKKNQKQNLIVIFYQGYFEILLAVYLNDQLKINDTRIDVASNLLGYFLGLCSVTLIPAIFIYVMNIPVESLRTVVTKKSFDKMYEELKYWYKPALANNLVYLARRLAMVTVFFAKFFTDNVVIQIITLIYIQAASIMYVFAHKPFIGKLNMFVEFVNEVTILISTESMLLYTEVLTPDQ